MELLIVIIAVYHIIIAVSQSPTYHIIKVKTINTFNTKVKTINTSNTILTRIESHKGRTR